MYKSDPLKRNPANGYGFAPRVETLPATFEQLYATIEYEPDKWDLLPTDLYRRVGTDLWKRQCQWLEEHIDPQETCTHILFAGKLYALNTDEGDELIEHAEQNLQALHAVMTAPSASAVPTSRGSSRVTLLLLWLIVLINGFNAAAHLMKP